MKHVLERSFPKVEIDFGLKGFPDFVVPFSVPHLIAEVAKRSIWLSNRVVNPDSNAFSVVILANDFTYVSISEDLGKDDIDTFNEIWRYA